MIPIVLLHDIRLVPDIVSDTKLKTISKYSNVFTITFEHITKIKRKKIMDSKNTFQYIMNVITKLLCSIRQKKIYLKTNLENS